MADSTHSEDATFTVLNADTRKMSQRIPFAMRLLKECGVTHIYARYERGITLAFYNKRHEPVRSLVCTAMMQPISLALQEILQERCPGYIRGEESQGYFEWDLRSDTLAHEHSMKFPEL